MALSWNEIKERAIAFSKKWDDATNEDSEAKPFLIDFFNIFGVSNRRVTSFEHRVEKLDHRDGYIDMLWKGNILIEMKSFGKNLDKAYNQARDYFPGLKEYELPKFILVCDFQKFRLYDLESDRRYDFNLKELYKKVNLFGFIAGYGAKVEIKEQDPVNIKAAEAMGKLHDQLKSIGYDGHDLELYLVRLLFCMFADDTTIFNKNVFYDYIIKYSTEDGSNLASVINEIFEILNTPVEKRLKNISDDLLAFPYVNGKLFEERLPLASFDSKMRDMLLNCCALDWGKISPAIFGSMFQSVMNPAERRNLGAHYTSETNILKLIKPLFLDDLLAEFEKVKGNEKLLTAFHEKISKLRFLDPACGCGNFLVITYRELRLLELEVLKILQGKQLVTNIEYRILCDVDSFFGIEYEEFPAQIAQVALWLMDHQMNMLFSQEFGQYFVRLPLRKSATIRHGDALEIDWNSLIANSELSYIVGNPPFSGSRKMSSEQKLQIIREFESIKGAGELDYVAAWYSKAAKFIQNTNIRVGFVSTNSIVQGLQTGIIWSYLINKYGIRIHFAHRTFKWSNEAKGKAAVYCIIVGFANFDTANKIIYEYDTVDGYPRVLQVKRINAYLADAEDVYLYNRTQPICNILKMNTGNMPADGGEFLFTSEEKQAFVKKEPESIAYFRHFISAEEFINGKERWCLWLQDIKPEELRRLKHIKERVENVKRIREMSSRPHLSQTPHLFAQITQPQELDFILIPRHSSERRKYIPIGFLDKNNIAADSCVIVPSATLFHFGILTSAMHMVWVNYVCGRLESRFRYSKDIVYNNFPWAENPTDKHIAKIEECAAKVLEARAMFADSSLADLYDPISMPPTLVKAHNELDRAVDAAYRSAPFTSDSSRIEFLFDLYTKYNSTLFTESKKTKRQK